MRKSRGNNKEVNIFLKRQKLETDRELRSPPLRRVLARRTTGFYVEELRSDFSKEQVFTYICSKKVLSQDLAEWEKMIGIMLASEKEEWTFIYSTLGDGINYTCHILNWAKRIERSFYPQIEYKRSTFRQKVVIPQRKKGYDDKGSLREGLSLDLLPVSKEPAQIATSFLFILRFFLSGVLPTGFDAFPTEEFQEGTKEEEDE